jgi:hypothetical protein
VREDIDDFCRPVRSLIGIRQNSRQKRLDFVNLMKPTYCRQNVTRQSHCIDVFGSGKFVEIVKRDEQRARLTRSFYLRTHVRGQ